MKQNLEAGGWVPQLVVVKDGEVVDNIPLCEKNVYSLGRDQDCDIVAGHPTISRRHLEIKVSHTSQELHITDLDTSFGTKMNGEFVSTLVSTAMHEGDKLKIASSTRTYMVKWIPVSPRSSESSSSCTPAVDLSQEFQSALKIPKSPARQPESARRLAFADLNGRSPIANSVTKPPRMNSLGASPMSKKAGIPESPKFKKSVPGSPKSRISESPKVRKVKKVGIPGSPGSKEFDPSASKLWLRRCNSNPLPAINTNSKVPPPVPPQRLPVFKENADADDILSSQQDEDEYPSDKENVAPVDTVIRQKNPLSVVERQPFRPLFYLPSPAAQAEYKPVFEPSPYASDEDSLTRMEMKNNRKMLAERRLKHPDASDLRKQWHIVVDTNCLIDEASFQALKQLEGIKETRLLVPKIVIRELDHLKKARNDEGSARGALRWIEKCMVKSPWWIHVQNNYETRPVGPTPPVSPSFLGKDFSQFGSAVDLLSPTNDDHVLDCALLFERSILEGRVALLTNDTALKIKAMAEGLCSEDSKTFCNSLLNPYSDRFLWAGSTALRTPRSPPDVPFNKPHEAAFHVGPNVELPKGLQLVLQS